jgi:hypothetical protein
MNIPDSLQSYDNVMTKYPNVYNNQHGNEHPGLFTILWQCMTKYTNVYNNQHGNEHPGLFTIIWQCMTTYTNIYNNQHRLITITVGNGEILTALW